MSDQNKVVKFKKRKSINIGIVIFLILFIYIAINVYIYLTKEQLTIYEVHEGSTAVQNKITALILRQEKIIPSTKAGYVLYYHKDGSRVAKDESIYSITENEIYNEDSSEDTSIVLSDKNDSEITHEIRNFRVIYSDDDFSKVYDFKDTTESAVLDILNNSLISDNQDNTLASGAAVSEESGIISYYTDDFESVTPENVTADMFNRESYKKQNLRTTDKITKNTPVYKMITSEVWNLVLPLTKSQYKKLGDQDKVKITVLEDQCEITASLTLMPKGTDYYAVLTIDKDMANYLGERYLDVEINFNSVKGLKIPNTSIVEKDFYEVPIAYFTQGGDSKDNGLIIVDYGKDGKVKNPFVATDIYNEDENYYYIDTKLFEAGTEIKLPDGSDTYKLSKTKKLSGVYNVNLGYAVFRRVEVLAHDDEYSIVSDHTSYGLSTYDHIVLDGKVAEDQKIIY